MRMKTKTRLADHTAKTCVHIRDILPLYLGRLIEFFLLWSAVQLVEYDSIWALS